MRVLSTALLALTATTASAQFSPYTPIDFTPYWHDGLSYHNYDAPPAWDYNMYAGWLTPWGPQGNNHVVWHIVNIPADAWWEFRVDATMTNGMFGAGFQVMLFDDVSQPFSTEWEGLYASGDSNGLTGTSESIYIELPAGPVLVAVDGYGWAQGKYDLRVRRSENADGYLVMYPWPNGFAQNQTVVTQ